MIDSLLDQPLVFFSLFIGMWIAVGFFIASMSGWRSLATVYGGNASAFTGRRWFMRSGSMRWAMHYNNALTIGADTRGLYLAVLFLFRVGHPPLYVPWDSIDITERKGWVFSYVVFTFKAVPSVYLTLAKGIGSEIVAVGGRRVAGEHSWSAV